MDIKSKLKNIKEEIRDVGNQKQILSNKQYKLNEEYVTLLQEKCKENIGRCFKKIENNEITGYYRIIDIDTVHFNIISGTNFNEYQYFVLFFEYPYDNTLVPFNKTKIHINILTNKNTFKSNVSYVEIDNKEFFKEFNKINLLWTNKLQL